MKRLVLFIFILAQSLLYANATGPSPEYLFMRALNRSVNQHQNLVLFYAGVLNLAKSRIESECTDTPDGEDCDVSGIAPITVTKEMAVASEIFYGTGEGFSEGETITMPDGTLTYRKLENSKLTYAVTLDLSKIEDDANEIIVFSWNDDGDILRVYYTDKDETYANTIVMMDKNGTKKMVFNGYFDTNNDNREVASGDAGTYIMEIQEENGSTAKGIIERLCYKDNRDPNNPIEVLSKGKIDNNGGFVYIDPWDNAYFDQNGNPRSPVVTIPEDTTNGAILVIKEVAGMELVAPRPVPVAIPRRFAVVKKDEVVGRYTILGYIAKAYGDGYEYEYFGDESLLAVKGATSDSDQLDIYVLDDKNKPSGDPVTNMWFTRE